MKRVCLCLVVIVLVLFSSLAFAEVAANMDSVREYNSSGKLTSIIYLNAAGEPEAPVDLGYASARYAYTNGKTLIRSEFFDAEGAPVDSVQGYQTLKVTVNSRNQVTERAYLDQEGNPALGPEGYARQTSRYWSNQLEETVTYDEAGNILRSYEVIYRNSDQFGRRKMGDAYRDGEGNYILGPDGYAYSEYEYEARRQTRLTYFDQDGNIVMNTKTKFAVYVLEYEWAKISRESWLDTHGHLIPGPGGYAYDVRSYPAGDTCQITYYNADGTPYYFEQGYCAVKQEYGVKNRVSYEAYYEMVLPENAADGEEDINLVVHEGNGVLRRIVIPEGYSALRRVYTSNGLIIREWYFDENERMINVPSLGYALIVNEYYSGRITGTYYQDANWKNTEDIHGIARIVYTYDRNNTLSGEKYLNLKGEPVPTKEGYSRVSYERDAEGNPLDIIYYLGDARFVLPEGYDEVRYVYTEAGKVETESYFRDDIPVNTSLGYARAEYEYNDDGKVTHRQYFGANGYPINIFHSKTGKLYSSVEYEYGAGGKVTMTRYRDSTGRIVNAEDRAYAYARTFYATDTDYFTAYYDESEQVLSSTYFYTDHAGHILREEKMDAQGTIYAVTTREWESGRMTDEYVFDGEDQPVLTSGGYHGLHRQYDPVGNVSAEWYTSLSGESVTSTSGYHRVEKNYENKMVVYEAWFDTD